jgi:uncharacterized protein (DUF1810 family)
MFLQRFHEAQASRSAGYDTALAEIRAGGKRSHWIWYIFPQIEGLGRSSTARAYAMQNLGEACAYLRDPPSSLAPSCSRLSPADLDVGEIIVRPTAQS